MMFYFMLEIRNMDSNQSAKDRKDKLYWVCFEKHWKCWSPILDLLDLDYVTGLLILRSSQLIFQPK